MNCKNCGANLPDNTKECPFCGTINETNETDVMNAQADPSTQNPLLGKEYAFSSSRGFGITGDARVYSKVSIAQDRMHIEIKPKKRNVCPVILFEDILAINITNQFAFWYIVMAALCVVLGIFTYVTFVLVPLWIWLGMNKKIVITQRNGTNVTILEKSKDIANTFKEEMKQITKIV